MEFVKIVLFSVLSAIAYGIVHDEVTAHLCADYFTIAHPPVFPTHSPFVLAIGWGIIATWWVGLPLGVLLAIAARVGSRAKLRLANLRPAILLLLAAMALCATVAGIVGAVLVANGMAPVPEGWARVIPAEKHVAFAADAWAHSASYLSGALGGLIVIGYTIRRRLRRSSALT